jgi:ribosomal protein S18 acetylase RimI-like enzyme
VLERRDLGHRVVIRRRVGVTGAGRPLLTDLLGELIDLDETTLRVRADDGREVLIDLADVTAAKPVPPRPVRHSEMAALERIADAAWPAPVHERLGEWYLRAADGWTNRANSALPLGDAGLPLAEAAAACRAWYGARGLTPRITVPLPLRRDVAHALAAADWHAQPPVLVQTAAMVDILAAAGPADDPPVTLLAEPSEAFIRVVAARKQSLPAAAHHVMTAVPAVRFAEVREDGSLLAQARGAVIEETLHLGLVEVDPAARRRGLGRRVSGALAQWAGGLGAVRAVLQVEEDNAAAVRLYAELGFTTHHRYITYAWLG